MKKLLLLLTICLFSTNQYAQEEITTELEKAYHEEKYNFIISEHSDKVSEYPAKAIFYVAMAYYMQANDHKVLELMDMSIKKDSIDPEAYFIKGMALNYIGQYDHAIETFNKAIALDSTDSKYYSGLGDSFISQEKYEDALNAYITATEKNEPIDRPFTMIPQIYAELNQPKKALEAYYTSKETISKESESYINALYNIGLYEYLNEDYDKAEIAFKELNELVPNDYHSIAKLVQVYYGKKDYEQVKPLKDKLYEAYNKGILKDDLKDQFCFDQFDWEDKYIFAFERFAENEGNLYYKHVFYVTNKESGKTEFTIQTENSPISVELGGPKYILGMDNNGTHSTFTYGLEADFNYDDLKKLVILVLEDKIKAGASSRPSKRND